MSKMYCCPGLEEELKNGLCANNNIPAYRFMNEIICKLVSLIVSQIIATFFLFFVFTLILLFRCQG